MPISSYINFSWVLGLVSRLFLWGKSARELWLAWNRAHVGGLSRASLQLSGRPVQETRTPREKVFISSQPFVFDSDRFQSFRLGSKWAWDGSKSPVYSQRPKRLCWRTWQVVPRFLHEWMMCPLLHARIPVSRTADWSHDVIRWVSEQTKSTSSYLR